MGSVALLRRHFSNSVRTVRMIVMIKPDAQMSGQIASYCRAYGVIDRWGAPKQAEMSRLALVHVFTHEAAAPIRAAIAARINAKMMFASLGPSLAKMWEFGRIQGNDGLIPRNFKLRIDKWIHDQLVHYSKYYRDNNGVIQDNLMYFMTIKKGLSDPSMQQTCREYQKIMVPVRRDIAAIEDSMFKTIKELKLKWTPRSA